MREQFVDFLLNGKAVSHGNIVCDDVSGEHSQIFVDAPDVQVMDAANTIHGVEFFHHFMHVNIVWRTLLQNVIGLALDAPRVPHYHSADQDTDERVEPVPFCEEDDDACDDRT